MLDFLNGDSCPCGSGERYPQCCKPYLEGERYPDNALALMRSRYVAYGINQADYLIQTTHRQNEAYRKDIKAWRKDLGAHCARLGIKGLEIKGFEPGESVSFVTFIAQFTLDGEPVVLCEKSRFEKVGQRWLY
ncbi:MAG: YchJ family metal-binding protein [Vampirovibrionales bacterium]|nr:YchJ family metal-binding protein [Vampirovibrionales bacterium]